MVQVPQAPKKQVRGNPSNAQGDSGHDIPSIHPVLMCQQSVAQFEVRVVFQHGETAFFVLQPAAMLAKRSKRHEITMEHG